MFTTATFILVLLAFFSFTASGEIDADKAAEISREIREIFRRTGFNFISPRMLQNLALKQNTKPILYYFTLRSCSDCRYLIEHFATYDKSMLSSLSAQFLSVLVLDDYSLEFGRDFQPGNADYVPRILFADPSGNLALQFKNDKADPSAPYMYTDTDEVISAMQKVLKHFQEKSGSLKYAADLTADL